MVGETTPEVVDEGTNAVLLGVELALEVESMLVAELWLADELARFPLTKTTRTAAYLRAVSESLMQIRIRQHTQQWQRRYPGALRL